MPSQRPLDLPTVNYLRYLELPFVNIFTECQRHTVDVLHCVLWYELNSGALGSPSYVSTTGTTFLMDTFSLNSHKLINTG